MDPTDFATTYASARQAFREAAWKAGARVDEYPNRRRSVLKTIGQAVRAADGLAPVRRP